MRKHLAIILLSCVAVCASAQDKTSWFDHLKVSGFAIGQYQYSSQKNNKSNSFNIRMARLAVNGDLPYNFAFKVQMQVNGNTSTLGSSPRLVDAYVDWKKYSFFQVRAGEFQLPFTFENPIHPIDVGFMNNAQAVLNLTGFSDRSGMHSSNGRDIGLMFQGDFLPTASGRNLLHYGVSVVNGQGINLKDVDQRKNVVATLWVAPVKGLRIGVSGMEGSYARKGTWTDEATGEARSGVRSLSQHRYAISADYNNSGWTLRSEYVHSTGAAFAKTENNTDDASATDCTLSSNGDKADGFYALAIAPVVKNKVNVKARYDSYRKDAHWDTAKTYYEIGADLFFTKHIKLSAEYALVNDRTLSDHNYSMLTTELAVRF